MIKKSSNKIISRNKEILGGTPVCKGTRVPVKALWDYLKAGDTVEDFLENFPSVKRKQAIDLIERAQKKSCQFQMTRILLDLCLPVNFK